KAIIGNGSLLLAGPYSDANGFALTLALATPFAALIARPALRAASFLLIASALLWTAGRTSIIAAALGLTLWVLMRHRSAVAARAVGAGAALVGAVLVVCTPFLHQNDPTAFSHRGLVWSVSLSDWRGGDYWF